MSTNSRPVTAVPAMHGIDNIELLELRLLESARSSNRRGTVQQIADILPPSRECSDILLAHGELWISWMHFALHSPTFSREHQEFWETGGSLQPQSKDDSLWLAIYFSYLCGVVLLLSEDEAADAGLPYNDSNLVLNNWYDAAVFFLNQGDFLRHHHIRSVQAVAVLSIVFNNIKDTSFQESILASAIRIAQALRLDQDAANTHASVIDRETRRRVWWTLMICEWLAIPHRPPCVSELDFDVAFPSLATDDEISPAKISLNSPSHQPRPVQYHIALSKIAIVYHRFRSLLRLTRWESSQITSVVIGADQELADLIDDLPPHLQADEVQTPKTQHRDLLHPWIAWQKSSLSTVLLYYRTLISRTLQGHWIDGDAVEARIRSICLGSAQGIISNIRAGPVADTRWRPW
ncbi:hypothetical protein BJY01DRAFT_228563 [Aspergillus pseudoustus]|uniref:Xylanolytic transcriptional activator regulatory domain-containing protein n=1 Tax=Aspergillus pseudoustus TaxID=1810923 RepID=A0ABR4IKP0_9EURO